MPTHSLGKHLWWAALIALLGCSSVHKLSELRNPRMEIDILFLMSGSRIFDLVIPNDGVGNDGCPKTVDSFRGFVNDVELDCAPGQQLDQRPYGGPLICAWPRCYLREGAIPNDTRVVPRRPAMVARAYDSSAEFELDTGDVLAGQDVVIASPTGDIRVGDQLQLVWRGPIDRVRGGSVMLLDQNRQSQWPRSLDFQTATVEGVSVRFTFPASPRGRGFLQLNGVEVSGRIDLCRGPTQCAAILDYAPLEIPVTVAQ